MDGQKREKKEGREGGRKKGRGRKRGEKEGRVIRLRNEVICIWYGSLASLPHRAFLVLKN